MLVSTMELRRRLTTVIVYEPTTATAGASTDIITIAIATAIISEVIVTLITVVALLLVATLTVGKSLDIVVIVPV